MDPIVVTPHKPEGFSLMNSVSACVVEWKGRFLLLKRAPGKPQPKTWCLPGGKLEAGEQIRDALVREVKEEAGIDICGESAAEIGSFYVRYQGIDFLFHMFFYAPEKEPFVSVDQEEHTESIWVTREEALKLPLIPGGLEVLSAYFAWRGL